MRQDVAPSIRARVAFGPLMEGFGSWEWIGQEMATALADRFETVTFRDEVLDCDVAVFVKFRPEAAALRRIAQRAAVVFCPVDGYGIAADIDADADVLSSTDQVVVHCQRLRKYVAPYARTAYIDHPLRFTAPLREERRKDGPIVWAGVRSNLPPLADWFRQHRLPEELWILTNPERPDRPLCSTDYGFHHPSRVRMERWTPERQREWTGLARAALDVKGTDFRARHKPPVKAFDFIASGVPFATNLDSSPAEHLRGLGFDPVSPDDPDRWLSEDYFRETVQMGRTLREHVSRDEVANTWGTTLENVLQRRRERTPDGTVIRLPAIMPEKTRCAGHDDATRPARIAILSLLFNWPSTGGGTIHTYEAAKFLKQAGYEVLHVYARHGAWGLGQGKRR